MTLGLYHDVCIFSKQSLSLYADMNSLFYTTKLLLWIAEAYLEDRTILNASEFFVYVSRLIESFGALKMESIKCYLFPRIVLLINYIQLEPDLSLQFSQLNDYKSKIGDLITEWTLNPKNNSEFISFVKNDHYKHIALASLPQILFKEDEDLQVREIFEDFYTRITQKDNSLYWVQYQEIIYHTAKTIFRSRGGYNAKKKRIALFTEFARKFLQLYSDNCKNTGILNPFILWKALNILLAIEYENLQFADSFWEVMKQTVKLSLLRINEQINPGKILLCDISDDIMSEMHSFKVPTSDHSDIKDLFEMEDSDAKIPNCDILAEDFLKYKAELETFIGESPRISGYRAFNLNHMFKKVVTVLQNSNPLLYNINSILGSETEAKDCVMLGWLMDGFVKDENSIPHKIFLIIENTLENAIPGQTSQYYPNNSKSASMIMFLRKKDQKTVIVRNINEKILIKISKLIKAALVTIGYYQTTKASTFIEEVQKNWIILFRVIHLIFAREEASSKVTTVNKDGNSPTFSA